MLRNLLRFLLIALVLVFIRYVAMAIRSAWMKVRGESASQRPPARPAPKRGAVPTTGSLKKDPVCGTFVAESASIKETIGGEVVHFCSAECRDRYHLVS